MVRPQGPLRETRPVDAIRPEEDLKIEFPQYVGSIELNAAFFKSGPGYSAKK